MLVDEVTFLRKRIDDLQAENSQLKTKLIPDIKSITSPLLAAGLLEWGQDAISAVDATVGTQIMGLILELKSTAIEPSSITQCDRIKHLFGEIGTISGVWPTPIQSAKLQAVLDVGSIETGPISAEYLSFTPWIVSVSNPI